jgi:hypothetical protein
MYAPTIVSKRHNPATGTKFRMRGLIATTPGPFFSVGSGGALLVC